MDDFALALLRTLGYMVDRVAGRAPYLWHALIRDCGGDPARIGLDELARLRPDTTALAEALASEPEPVTESWVLDTLAALGLGIADFVRFAIDLEGRTGAADLAWRALERQIVSDAAGHSPMALDLAQLVGVVSRHVEHHAEPVDEGDLFEDWSVRWSSLQALLRDPAAWLRDLLGQLPITLPLALGRVLRHMESPVQVGAPREELRQALADGGVEIADLHTEVSVWLPPLVDDGTRLLAFQVMAGFLGPTDAIGLRGLALAAGSSGGLRETLTWNLADAVALAFTLEADARLLVGLAFTPDLSLFGRATGRVGGELRLSWQPPAPAAESGSGLPVTPVLSRLELFATVSGDAATGGAFSPAAGLGFAADGEIRFDLGSALPIEVVDAVMVVPWSVELGWDSARPGLGIEGSFSLRSPPLPTLTLGPVSLSDLTVGLEIGSAEAKVDLTFGVGLELGPLTVRAAGLGAFGRVPMPETEEAARSGLTFGFIPPTALEISADNPPMLSGGGAILFEENRYSGFLTLQVYDFGVTALGLLEVNLPPPGPDFSLFVLVSASFPGIQLGYGFTLNGLGGLVGIHRTVDADALRADLPSGSVSSILDPGSEMDRAIELLARMARYFPTRADRFVIGLAVQLRWVELVQVDIGLIIELPGPAKIILLGRARIALESDDVALVRIQLQVLGIVDFEEKLLSIDAALTDSTLLEIFDITGGAAVRVSWGERPYALMSVGGFHPEFVPEPAVVPVPDRVGLSAGSPEDWFYLRLETYFAVTTSSLQLGAAVEVRINLEVITAEGGLGFDALIVFDPFYFSISFFAHFRVKLLGVSLAGVSMRGTMSGPGPVTISGEITVEILFVTVSWSGSFAIGSEASLEIATIDSVLDQVMAQLGPEALRATASGHPGALVQGPEGETALFLDPAGGFEWTQGLVPLGVVVERLEGSPLRRPLELRVVRASDLEPAYDWFAAAAFAELSDAEALTRKTFERLEAGAGASSGARAAAETGAVEHELAPEVHVLPGVRLSAGGVLQLVPRAAALAARHRGARTPAIAAAPVLALREERWTAGTSGEPMPETAAHQKARHDGGIAVPLGDAMAVGEL